MKYLTVLTLLLGTFELTAKTHTSDLSQISKPATIRVLIEKNIPATFLEISGPHRIYDRLSGEILSRGLLNKHHAVTVEEYGLNWGEKIPGVTQLRIVPLSPATLILLNGTPYKGCLEIHAHDNTLSIISEIDTESFLKKTLPSHFDKPLPTELMRAIAITARTHAYYLAAKNQETPFDLDGTTFDYKGNLLSTRQEFIDEAVDTTRHAILTFKGNPFPATWTQDSAGKTATFSTIFRKTTSTPSATTLPLALRHLESRKWQCVVPKNILAEHAHLDTLASLDLFVDQTSSKVYALKLSSHSDSKEFDFVNFQKLLGHPNLLSNHFTVALKGDDVIFTGYGEGLGVGLCLYTGKILAEKGKSAPQILSSFFPSTELHKVRSLN